MKNKLNRFLIKIKRLLKQAKIKIYRQIDAYPLQTFFGLLGIILILIFIGNFFRRPKNKLEKNVSSPKAVEIYSIGSAPKISLQAKIEKSGVIKITALIGGVIQSIYKNEGDVIYQGDWLLGMSTNYQGGTAPTLTRQIAQTNYQFLLDNYPIQKDIIAKNREVAETVENQAAELRTISSQSIDETKSLIALNENIINLLDEQINYLESVNVNGANDSTIIQLKTGKAAALAGLNQAKSAQRNLEYQTDNENEPAKLATLQKDITLKQLELQEKTLDLNKEIALLNLRLAQVQESLMYPAAPFDGVIERIYVKIGQNVTPGTPLALLTGNINKAKAIVATTAEIANNISRLEPSQISIGGKIHEVYPLYISQEPTQTNLHSVVYLIPDDLANQLKNDQIISIQIPLGSIDSLSVVPFIPLDAIYQTQDTAFVNVVTTRNKQKFVTTKKIELGQSYGAYVEVIHGLNRGDQIILNRNVIEGDRIEINHR